MVPRLVPVPNRGIGRVREGPWTAGFYPGDLCLRVTEVMPDSPAGRAGLRPGDLVIRLNGQPCGDGLFVDRLLPGGAAEEAGLALPRRIDSIA